MIKDSKALLYICLVAFLSFVIYLLTVNQEVLLTAQDRSEFLYGTPFFYTLLSKPFGLIQYVGAWLTQLFYYPTLGAGVLVTIWILILVVGAKAFRLQGYAIALLLLPIACLLTATLDLGYWIYISVIRGYWFSQSVGYLSMLLLLWGARCTPRQWHVVWYLLGVGLFPVLGWFALLFVLCLILSERFTRMELVGLVLLLLSVGIWHSLLYSHLNLAQVAWAGFPRFSVPSAESPRLSVPFWILGIVTIVIPLAGRYLNKFYIPVISVALGVVLTMSCMFNDRNYINEMRMTRSAEAEDWKEVLTIYEAAEELTLSMVMLKNIALMHEGELLERSFQLNNSGAAMYNPDSLNVSFLEIASPIAYYNYGMMNEGFRLAFECAVQSGFSPFYLRSLARCAHANGEDNLAGRYLAQLHHHPFYGQWQPAEVSANVRELQYCYPDEISGVENTVSYLSSSISLWYSSNSKLASEQSLLYAMLRCDARRFWPSLRKFIELHIGEDFPVHPQEAYIMFMDKAPEARKMKIPVSREIYNRYVQFWNTLESYMSSGLSKSETAEKMRQEYGDTFWYYNIFGKKII